MDDSIFDRAIKYISIRPRSEKEVLDYLKQKKINLSLSKRIIFKLKKLKLLNDLEFAKFFVESRLSQNKSRKAIFRELQFKGVAREIIDEIFDQMKIDDLMSAKNLISKKYYKWKNLDLRTRYQKIAQFLISKGFDWGTINDIIKKIEGDANLYEN